MNPQPKTKPARCPAYLAFIRGQKCCLTGHVGEIEAHHEPEKGNGGTATKPCDSRTVPVYWKLHRKMETPGNSRASVWAEYGKEPEAVIKSMRELWIRQGGKVFW